MCLTERSALECNAGGKWMSVCLLRVWGETPRQRYRNRKEESDSIIQWEAVWSGLLRAVSLAGPFIWGWLRNVHVTQVGESLRSIKARRENKMWKLMVWCLPKYLSTPIFTVSPPLHTNELCVLGEWLSLHSKTKGLDLDPNFFYNLCSN